MKKLLILIPLAIAYFGLNAQPVSNPYRDRYALINKHWTDSLKWNTVTDATTIGVIPNDNLDDSAAVASAINTIYQAGGGVLYFPAGTYNFSGSIKLKSGVILRGAPVTGITDAKVPGYNPPTNFIFPKYIFDTTYNNGNGYPISSAFKVIKSEFSCSNIGVVDIDINRAYITFHPDYDANNQPIQQNRNIIVMGTRSQNAAHPTPGVPRTQQRPWQKYSWRFVANVDINASGNVVVAYNRCNGRKNQIPNTTPSQVQSDTSEFEDDTYNQPKYIFNQRNTSIWRTDANDPTGYKTRFDYTEHYGISVNRKKKTIDPATNDYKMLGVATFANPNNEPSLFSPNMEVLDNYVYHSSRVAFIGAGIGLVMRGNRSEMDPRKEFVEQRLVAPVGTTSLQGATTLENRGLDFSGWNCTIEDNDLNVYRDKIGAYLSTDGEGILVQECCGGTSINDYLIKGNKTHGSYIGLYKMRDINNAVIRDNDLGGGPIWVWANTNNSTFYLNKTHIINNIGVSGISMNGDKGGFDVVVDSNQAQGTGRTITAPCYTDVKANNYASGFNSPFTVTPAGTSPCLPTADMPNITIVSPTANLNTCSIASVTYPVVFKMLSGSLDSSTFDVYVNNVRVAQGLTFGPDSLYSYTMPLPTAQQFSLAVTAQMRQTVAPATWSFSQVITLFRACPVVTSLNSETINQQPKFSVYPNPAKGVVTFEANTDGFTQLTITDLSGKVVKFARLNGTQQTIDLNGIANGIYVVRVAGAYVSAYTKLIIE